MPAPIRVTALSLQGYGLFRPSAERPIGGAELQISLILRGLAQREDFLPSMIALDRGPARVETIDGVDIHIVPRRRGIWKARLSFDVLNTLYRIGPEIVLQRGYGYETAIAAWYAASQCVSFVHMLASEDDVGPAGGWAAWHPMRLAHRYGLHRAARIYAQHSGQQRDLRERLNLDSIILRSMHPIPPFPPQPGRELLWVGRCIPVKQPHVFLDLAQRFPDTPARMVCPPAHDNELYQSVAKRAAALPNLHFHPGLPLQETERLFPQARVYAQTSLKEGFPNTLVQACKYGVPIVSLNVNPDAVITLHELGGFAAGDLDAMAAQIERLLCDDAYHAACRANAYRYAVEHHDIERILPILASAFRRLSGEV